ncbi:uncharacterized protein [Chaetodon trifascialis]|uniref:uncharacterized protein n=1 Tax=Chaetodon trifascialis TaxID=109706 RepID=UPI00399165A8
MKGPPSPPSSPGLNKPMGDGVNGQSSNAPQADVPKKRRAPQPPMGASQSVPSNLSTCHLRGPQRSAESTLRSTKRRAPPPPCANTHQEPQSDAEVKGTVDSLNPVEELRESDDSDSVDLSLSSSSSPHPSQPRPSSSSSRPSFAHLHEIADPYLPSFRGKDFSDARSALAKVLTSSVSKGTLVKRLRNSATFPKSHNGSSFVSMHPACSDDGAGVEPVLTHRLPTEPEWEDPVQRRGLTTFKVVPSKKQKSHDRELTSDAPDQSVTEDNPESDVCPELGKNQTEAEEDPGSPDRSETPLLSPERSSPEVQASDGPASPPRPLDLDHQDGPGSPVPQDGYAVEKQEEEDEPEVTSEVITLSDCSDGELPGDGQMKSEDQSESLQSPSRRSVSTDMDHCESYTDEREAEEEEEDSFPPPPSPVFFNEDLEIAEAGREDPAASSPPSPQPPSPTSDEPASATPDRPAAAPAPQEKTSAGPSRFAQAVALAVQRSRLQRSGKALGPQSPDGPHSTLPSPSRSLYQFGA